MLNLFSALNEPDWLLFCDAVLFNLDYSLTLQLLSLSLRYFTITLPFNHAIDDIDFSELCRIDLLWSVF
jgi:hypothetical protein